jgi:HEAT repeat protein
VREAAAWSLGELGEQAPVAYLTYAFRSDPDEIVRAAAAEALGKSRNKQIKSLLQDIQSKGEHEEVLQAIETALEELEKGNESPQSTVRPEALANITRSSQKEDLPKKGYHRKVLRDIFCEEYPQESSPSEKKVVGVKYEQGRNTEELYLIEEMTEEDIKRLYEII